MDGDYVVPEDHCPRCNAKHDRAMEMEKGRGPSPGDFSICFRCGEILCFDREMKLYIPGPKTLGDLEVDQLRDMKRAQRLIRAKRLVQGIN